MHLTITLFAFLPFYFYFLDFLWFWLFAFLAFCLFDFFSFFTFIFLIVCLLTFWHLTFWHLTFCLLAFCHLIVWTSPRSNSAPGSCSDTLWAAFERAPKIITLLVWSFFRSGQRSGHQKSPKVKFCRQHFSTNRHITREPEDLQRPAKAHSMAFLTRFR